MVAINWKIRQALEARGIHNASQLQAALEKDLGLQLSRVALDKLLKNQPAYIRLKTMQILCDFLQLPLEAFLSVTPEVVIKPPGGVIQPYGKQEKGFDSFMVDPGQFF